MSQQIVQGRTGGAAPISRTAEGLRYEKWINAAREQLRGMTEESKKIALAQNVDFARALGCEIHGEGARAELVQRSVNPSAVHTDTMLSQMSVMYANDAYIGDRLMPAVPVAFRSDKYAVYPKRERLAFPSDEITSRSEANEVESTRTSDNYSVKDYALANYIDLATLSNQDRPFDEMVDLVDAINEGLLFHREKRILTIVSTAANYAGNTAAAATDWTAANSGGSVIADITGANDAVWVGATRTKRIGFCTLAVWNTNILGNAALAERMKYVQMGLITTQIVAGWFGLDDILVIRSREDTANSGQTASYSRMATAVNEIFGVLAVAEKPSLRSVHFGSTFRLQGDPVTTQWFDPKVGRQGGIRARVAVSEDHKVVAGDAGFLITSINT